MIEISTLVAAGIGPTQARLFAAPLAAACERFGIDTPRRMAAFVAQCAHESRLFAALEEGLFYRDPARICKIFRSSVPTLAVAQGLRVQPEVARQSRLRQPQRQSATRPAATAGAIAAAA